MPFFDAQGSPLSDADAALRQYEGHVVFDANGKVATVVLANVSVDTAGDTAMQLGEDATSVEP